MSDELQNRMNHMAQRAQSDSLRRAESLLAENEDILATAVGSNGVLLLGKDRVVYSLGKGAVRRSGELVLEQMSVSVEKEEGNLMESLKFGEGLMLRGVGAVAAADFLSAAKEALAQKRTGLSPIDHSFSHPQGDGILVSLKKPEDYHDLVGLLEKLSMLMHDGYLTALEFDRLKRSMLR